LPAALVTTAGHVDHGKSTLVRALTGHDPDRWEQERARGLSIDLGFEWTTGHRLREGLIGPAALDVPRTWQDPDDLVFFVDVPGHERFLDNLLTAMVDARCVLVVVSAVEGWSNGTQTHVDILDALGVTHGLVAVSRADDRAAAPAGELVEEIGTWLAGTSLAGAPVVPTDSVTGTGLAEFVDVLLPAVASAPPPRAGHMRLWVDRSFSLRGAGTVVTGQLEGGQCRLGDVVHVAPSGGQATIRSLHVAGRPVEQAASGSRVAVNLRGMPVERVGRGSALVARSKTGDGLHGESPVMSDRIVARVTVTSPAGIQSRGAWIVHVGTAKVAAGISLLEGRRAQRGQAVLARFRLSAPLPVLVGDRFLLWDAGRRAVAGGGVMLHVEPGEQRRRIPVAERAALLRAIDPAGRSEALAVGLLELAGGWQLASELQWSADLPDGLPDGLTMVGPWALSPRMWDELRTAAIMVAESRPRSSREVMTDALLQRAPGLPTPLVHRALDQLVAARVIARVGTEFVLPGDVEALVQERAERTAALVAVLQAGGLEPPDLESARRAAGVSATDVSTLAAEGKLLLTEQLAFDRDAVTCAIERLYEALGHDWFPVTEARQLLGIRRRYALALLHGLDRSGWTEVRSDGLRRLLPTRR
jgi:selenocysteine-specific elongation factor